jgi:acyl-CoA synthetase (AMP-forming)/AMP-acid ligase II
VQGTLSLIGSEILRLTFMQHPAVKNYDLSVVTYVMVGAAPLAKEINQKLFEIFPTAQIGQAYGRSGLLDALCPFLIATCVQV